MTSVAVRTPSACAWAGWAIRPRWLTETRLAKATRVALAGATLLLGMVLAGGINWAGGALLGGVTYASQVLVAWLVVPFAGRLVRTEVSEERRFSARETWQLGLGQTAGITAIVIALNVEVVISGTVATISPAIVTINVCHLLVNAIFDMIDRRVWPPS